VEYWFQGNDHAYLEDIYSSSGAEQDYQVECLNNESGENSTSFTSSRTCPECSTKLEVLSGEADVLGSHYRIVIWFPNNPVVLSPEQEDGKSFHEESVTIKYLRSHMGLSPLYDYSFMNTAPIDTAFISIPNAQNRSYRSRAFMKNHKMPVYMWRNLIWGSPPIKGDQRVVITLAD